MADNKAPKNVALFLTSVGFIVLGYCLWQHLDYARREAMGIGPELYGGHGEPAAFTILIGVIILLGGLIMWAISATRHP